MAIKHPDLDAEKVREAAELSSSRAEVARRLDVSNAFLYKQIRTRAELRKIFLKHQSRYEAEQKNKSTWRRSHHVLFLK